jgi:hypothetical protein
VFVTDSALFSTLARKHKILAGLPAVIGGKGVDWWINVVGPEFRHHHLDKANMDKANIGKDKDTAAAMRSV